MSTRLRARSPTSDRVAPSEVRSSTSRRSEASATASGRAPAIRPMSTWPTSPRMRWQMIAPRSSCCTSRTSATGTGWSAPSPRQPSVGNTSCCCEVGEAPKAAGRRAHIQGRSSATTSSRSIWRRDAHVRYWSRTSTRCSTPPACSRASASEAGKPARSRHDIGRGRHPRRGSGGSAWLHRSAPIGGDAGDAPTAASRIRGELQIPST